MRKWIIRISLALLLLVLMCVGGLIFFIRKNYSPEKVKAELEQALKQKTGLSVTIGSLEFTWSGDIKLREICVKNPALVSTRCVIAANITSLDLRVLPLLKKRIEIRAAHLEDMAVNLFTEQSRDKAGKVQVMRSWDLPLSTPVAASSGSAAEFRLDALRISNGIILHEAPALPLPLGNNKFTLAFSEGVEKKVKFSIEYPDGGFTGLNVKVRSENILQSLRSLLKDGKAVDADTISGQLECKRCNPSSIDKRLNSITGKFDLEGAHNRVTIAGERVELSVVAPVAGIFGYSGKFTLVLPAFAAEDASGSLSATGVTIAYSGFSVHPVTGAKGNFDATVDFTSARNLLHLPPNIKGVAAAHGQFDKNVAVGTVRVKNFEYAAAPGMLVSSPDFSAGFVNSTLTLTNQPFSFNQNNLNVSGKVASSELHLRIAAPAIQYQKWRVENFSGNLHKSGDTIRLDDATMVFARGRVGASYARTGATRAQSLKLNAQGMKGQDLSAIFGFKTTVFGDVSADASMTFQGDGMEEIRKSITGSGTLRIGRGKIKDSFMQKGVLSGPLHKLEEKFSDIEFASGSADVAFTAGRINARKVFFDAEEWNITMRAEADSDGAGKAALDFRFRTSFVANVANPLHLGIEGRKEGDFYELPFACRGNVFSGACYKQNW